MEKNQTNHVQTTLCATLYLSFLTTKAHKEPHETTQMVCLFLHHPHRFPVYLEKIQPLCQVRNIYPRFGRG